MSKTWVMLKTEYREVLGISPYSAWMWENADENNSEYDHFLRSVWFRKSPFGHFSRSGKKCEVGSTSQP